MATDTHLGTSTPWIRERHRGKANTKQGASDWVGFHCEATSAQECTVNVAEERTLRKGSPVGGRSAARKSTHNVTTHKRPCTQTRTTKRGMNEMNKRPSPAAPCCNTSSCLPRDCLQQWRTRGQPRCSTHPSRQRLRHHHKTVEQQDPSTWSSEIEVGWQRETCL